jgi:GNAT superfamily N-acetyltransferase
VALQVGSTKDLNWYRQALKVIRFAQINDVPRVLELCSLHAKYERASVDLSEKQSALESALFSTTEATSDPPLYCWVVELNQRLVGYATATIDFSTWHCKRYLHLDCIFIEQSHRGSGIGNELMDTISDFAKAKGINQIQWQTPLWNKKAIAFYEKLGASRLEKSRFTWAVGQDC